MSLWKFASVMRTIREMMLFRLALIVLLSMMLDVAAPLAVGSTEAPDGMEDAVHRPRSSTTILLVRDLPASKMEAQVQSSSNHVPRSVYVTLRYLVRRQSISKTPPLVTHSPAPFEEH